MGADRTSVFGRHIGNSVPRTLTTWDLAGVLVVVVDCMMGDIYTRGGTDRGQVQDRDRPGYLIFLTDGLPTIGEKNSAKIAQNARQWNESRIRLFAFGVGYDVTSRLLDRLVNDNHGQAHHSKADPHPTPHR